VWQEFYANSANQRQQRSNHKLPPGPKPSLKHQAERQIRCIQPP